MTIRPATKQDGDSVAYLMQALWQTSSLAELRAEGEALLKSEDAVIVLAFWEAKPVGFAQGQLRYDYVEGTSTSPVGYLEGIYIEPAYRGRGIAAGLLKAVEHWAVEKDCSEFASDTSTENTESIAFHKKLGFKEANRLVCFTKKLSPAKDNSAEKEG